MPAIEANEETLSEVKSYELAFHILPTVAEGEVSDIFENIKTSLGSNVHFITEEAPERIELAYPMVKSIEGRNRKFTSAYFGWVRFTCEPEYTATIHELCTTHPQILRFLLVSLRAHEEAQPFRFHENRKSVKMVEVIDEESAILEESPREIEESAEVSDEALEESLTKITTEEKAA